MLKNSVSFVISCRKMFDRDFVDSAGVLFRFSKSDAR
jgi:hypothetical protein